MTRISYFHNEISKIIQSRKGIAMNGHEHHYLPLSSVKITSGFWKNRQNLNKNTTASAVYEQFHKSGRIGCVLHDPEPGEANPPPIAWDSDVFKWM